MKRRQIKPFLFLIVVYFSAFLTNGNAKFGDYMKKRLNNASHTVDTQMTKTTENDHFRINSQHAKPPKTAHGKNFEIREVRLYENNPSPMYENREKKMLESLFPDDAFQPGQDFDIRKQIYGPDLKKEFDSMLENTSPSWDRLQALLKKVDKMTRLPQSMYYDEEEAKKDALNAAKFKKPRTNSRKNTSKGEDISLGTMFKRNLQMPNSMYDLSMNFGGRHQIYPFAGDFSLSDAIFRNKREVHRDNSFPQFPADRKPTVSYQQSFGYHGDSHFRGPPAAGQFARTMNKFTYEFFRPNVRSGRENEARKFYATCSSHRNSRNNNFTRIRHEITSKITKLTPHGTLDSTWKELLKQMNPIQQKIIHDLFLYGPPTTSDQRSQTTRTSLSAKDSSLIFSSSSPWQYGAAVSISTKKFRIREIYRRSTPAIQNNSKKVFTYGQLWLTKSTISPELRVSVTIDGKLMKEWLKSLNPQDREEMENLFFNGHSSPSFDINNVESIKNAIKNEFLQGSRKTSGKFSANNLKSTFISRKGNRNRHVEDIGYYNYEDLSRLLKQAPQDKLKIVDDWCEEIERDLHRRFPTGTTKYGETRDPRPFYPTRYYPWELFSMLPDQN